MTSIGELTHSFKVKGETEDRLDKLLLEELRTLPGWEAYSRSQLKLLVDEGLVFVDGKPALKAGMIVSPGSLVVLSGRDLSRTSLVPAEIPLEILFEDDAIIVINKPFGLSMHPGAGRREGTLANALVGKIRDSEGDRPGIVHRLDKDTTGVVVVAKTQTALFHLGAQFAERSVRRVYTTLVLLTPRATREVGSHEKGEIETLIGRHPTQRIKMAVVDEGKIGKSALTRWSKIERFSYGALLEVILGTGRTHQIRVHMDYLKSPIIGDRLYGDFTPLPRILRDAASTFGRQALHAGFLEFSHPVSKKRISFSSPLPQDFANLVALFRATRA